MPKPQATTQDTINPTLLAFKPRQVQLLNLDMKHSNPNISSQRTQTLTHDQKGPLLHAVARFLESNGFSKTLKKFRSEAEIEKSGPKDSLLDLEEMYCKYSEMCSNGGTNVNSQKEKDLVLDLIKEADKICKEKKKKKSKIASDSLAGTVEPQLESIPDAVPVKGKDVSDPETKKKPKDKKKNKSNSDSVGANVEKHAVEGKKDENGIDKGSKKRKRLASEGNDSQPADNREDEESKRRKVEGLKASKGSAQQENSDASLGRAENEENGQVGPDAFQKTPVKQLDGLVNGNLDKTAEKSIKKSMKKEHKDSAEPKTVKAFQRVKVDEVEFVDDKLRDNSYWAKDGAEIGYGAKAQEILGQVRGRDFRHEKTKKKRGTYRGGQIDLQSHSVKFNYSDEE